MIFSFVARARRRYLWNELLQQFVLGISLALGGLVLLLLFGTQLLDWRLVALFAAAGVAAICHRTVARMPSAYKLAVLLDRRAGLHDALSTALYFEQSHLDPAQSKHNRSHGLPAIREFQKRQAERLVSAIDLKGVMPFRLPRAIYSVLILALAAGGLFALRYGIRHTIDFRPPISQVVLDGLGVRAPEQALAERKKQGRKTAESESDEPGAPLAKSGEKRAGELEAAPPNALETVSDPDVNNEKAQASKEGKEGSSKTAQGGKEAGDQAPSEQAQNGQPSAKTGEENPAGSREGPQQGAQGESRQGGQPNSSSLLSKMKDAMQNLMAKAQPQQSGASGQKPGAQQGKKVQSQQSKAGEKGKPGDSKDGAPQEQAEGQQGQQANGEDNAEDGKGKGNGNSDRQAAAQPGSGIGKQDGAKDVKAAEQKAAMGKLSEVIGKRSATVSGEMMVESQSGPQQLRTQYSRRNASHGETGGEVNRDEVPVDLQDYVQQYFEQVRKTGQGQTAARKPAAK